MRRSKVLKRAGVLALGLCLGLSAGASFGENHARGGIGGGDDPETVGEILREGLLAEAQGDGEALMAAAFALSQSGAQPEMGEPDLVRIWVRAAQKLGANIPKTYAFRGRTLGPAYRSGRISAGGRFVTRQTFNGGQVADILIVPATGAELSLKVADETGEAVCEVAPSSENLGCRWVPPYTGGNAITVYNDSQRPARFYIVMN